MNVIHIIILWVIFVFLVATYLIAKLLAKKNRFGYGDENFVQDFVDKKQNIIDKNDINMSITTYMSILILCPLLIGVGAYLLSQNIFMALILGISSILIPDTIIMILKERENKIFEEKYERSLEQLSSSLRAGLSIMQAVKEVSENKFIYEPLRKRYAKLYADLTMGVPINTAFKTFAESTNSADAMDVALVIDVQGEAGGREAEAVMLIAKDIRERLMLRKELRSMFASTTYMVYTMDILPLLIMLWLTLTNKSFKDYYFNGLHIIILAGLIFVCLLGSLINHRKIKKIMKGV